MGAHRAIHRMQPLYINRRRSQFASYNAIDFYASVRQGFLHSRVKSDTLPPQASVHVSGSRGVWACRLHRPRSPPTPPHYPPCLFSAQWRGDSRPRDALRIARAYITNKHGERCIQYRTPNKKLTLTILGNWSFKRVSRT
ncbi:unnamed protein product [Colias eurytheme]|nr:unnamed protein product [Colias eurytheme]